MQEKTNKLYQTGMQVGLKISFMKSKVVRINCKDEGHIALTDISLISCRTRRVEKFTSLGTPVAKVGGSSTGVTERINRARASIL